MGGSPEVPCVGNVQAVKVNGCAFPATAVIVVEDVPVAVGQLGTIVVTTCDLHFRQVMRYLEQAYPEAGEATIAPVEDRQLVVDTLEMSGHQVLEMQAA